MQIPATFIIYDIGNICGLTVYAYYAKLGCDPLRSGAVKSSNQVNSIIGHAFVACFDSCKSYITLYLTFV